MGPQPASRSLSTVVIILGGANLLADGLSMAASNYLGSRAERQRRALVREEERRHIELVPDVWTDTMMSEELGYGIAEPNELRAAASTFVAQRWWRSGLETLLVGGLAATVAYFVGALLQGIA